MTSERAGDSEVTNALLRRASRGDRSALDELFAHHRGRLLRMVRMRMDRRVQGRIGASDILQESLTEAWERLPDYLQDRGMPFFLWLRFLTRQKVLELHRRHLGAKARDVRREVRLHQGPMPSATSATLAQQLMGKQTSPSLAAARVEDRMKLQEALNRMEDPDREILCLRHFEQLSVAEAARELGIGESAASKRYLRALRKIRGFLSHLADA